jgi:hypothetical protein
MDRKTLKGIRRYGQATGQTEKQLKRDWLKLSHRERGRLRSKLTGKGTLERARKAMKP